MLFKGLFCLIRCLSQNDSNEGLGIAQLRLEVSVNANLDQLFKNRLVNLIQDQTTSKIIMTKIL